MENITKRMEEDLEARMLAEGESYIYQIERQLRNENLSTRGVIWIDVREYKELKENRLKGEDIVCGL